VVLNFLGTMDVRGVEGPAGDPVGRGAGNKWEGEEPLQDPGLLCRWVMRPGGTGLPLLYDVGRLVPVEEDAGSDVSEWERREREE